MKVTRREFLKGSLTTGAVVAVGGAGVLLTPRQASAFANSGNLAKWIADPAWAFRGLSLAGMGLPGILMPNGTSVDTLGIPALSSIADPVYNYPGTYPTQFYQVAVGEFKDQLHRDLRPTTLWGYWDNNSNSAVYQNKRHLAGVIVTVRRTQGTSVAGIPPAAARLRFTNTLPATSIIPVDTTIPGANQAQNRVAVHLHGGFIPWISDGGPFDWWAPNGTSGMSFLNGPGGGVFSGLAAGQADYFYPNDQSTRLMWYHDHAHGITRTNAYSGIATGYLVLDPTNDGIRLTSANKVPGLLDVSGRWQTIPMVWQDKIFVNSTTATTDPTWNTVARSDLRTTNTTNNPGSLWYAHQYETKRWALGPGKSARNLPNPSVVAEFFGDTMLCNGSVYPLLTVEPKRYRFLMLNACNARFLNVNTFVANATADGITINPRTQYPTNIKGPNIIQIGNEAGLLWKEVTYTGAPFNIGTVASGPTGNLIMGPAERADVIVDFTAFANKDIIFYTDAPAPFPAGTPINDYYMGNVLNLVRTPAGKGPDTRQILRIRVLGSATIPDSQPGGAILVSDYTKLDPQLFVDPASYYHPLTGIVDPMPLPNGAPIRQLSLNEGFDAYGRLIQLVGTNVFNPATGTYGLEYLDPSTENVTAGATEVWQIFNFTGDTHPMHFHLVNVQVLARQPFDTAAANPFAIANAATGAVVNALGPQRGPYLNELGWKETVKMHPGEVITVAMTFDLPAVPSTLNIPASPRTGNNEYVWHCHILEHEEHDMMRPLVVTGANPTITVP